MNTRNWTLGGIGLAVAVMAALTVTACDPYTAANSSAPVVLGVVMVDINGNGYNPPGYAADGCFVPYPEPDLTWGQATFPGLCDPTYLDLGRPTVCPVACYPPRIGPAYAPFFLGDVGGSYVAQPLIPGGATRIIDYALPADGKFVVRHVPPGAAPAPASDFEFAQIQVQFNKLLNPASVQPDPTICAPATGANGPKVYRISPAASAGIGTDVTATFAICYLPNASASYFGASITATPPGSLDPDTKYTFLGTVQDQQGNNVSIDVTILTDPAVAAVRAR